VGYFSLTNEHLAVKIGRKKTITNSIKKAMEKAPPFVSQYRVRPQDIASQQDWEILDQEQETFLLSLKNKKAPRFLGGL
jgi:hypothetical protein